MSSSDDLEDLVREFLVESHENLQRLDQELLAIERGDFGPETFASIFRTAHSIKGACGFFGFVRLEALTHAGESLLARLRSGRVSASPDVAAVLLRLVDAIRAHLAVIEAEGAERGGDDDDLIAALTRLAGASIAPPAGSVFAQPLSPVTPFTAPAAVAPPIAAMPAFTMEVPAPASERSAAPAEEASAGGALADGYVRLDVALLDRLMNLVGELVLARNEIIRHSARVNDLALVTTAQRLDFVTAELQEGVMRTRMQPVGSLWRKFPRLVRDLAKECGKEVRLELEGAETELDRTVIEAIKDPFTHIIRNAVDHGIESPQERVRAGKPAEGRIALRAYHEGGVVIIEVADDGDGISVDRVRVGAIRKGIITLAQADSMSERELINLIFTPGFSTADHVTSVSGRGVGMDVVRTNIERIGGSLDLLSRAGEGVRLRIKIPLTLAIVPALVIDCAGERYAIPQVSLVELVRLEGDKIRATVERLFDVEVFRLRDKLLPLVSLASLLHPDRPAKTDAGSLEIVVLQADERQFGLVVDSVTEMQEIVVKPLGRLLESATVFAGATILGDGRVSLILDVLGLAQRAEVVGDLDARAFSRIAAPVPEGREERQSMLVLSLPDGGRVAIPLTDVARIEEIMMDRVERVGGGQVVQYRGEILPLVHLGSVLPERRSAPRDGERAPASDVLRVVVHAGDSGHVGLVVDQVIDVVEEAISLNRSSTRTGVLGTAVILARVTELLDVRTIVRASGVGRRAEGDA